MVSSRPCSSTLFCMGVSLRTSFAITQLYDAAVFCIPTPMAANWLRNKSDLISAALALGARSVRGWSSQEERLVAKALPVTKERAGLVSVAERLGNGAVFKRLGFVRNDEVGQKN